MANTKISIDALSKTVMTELNEYVCHSALCVLLRQPGK